CLASKNILIPSPTTKRPIPLMATVWYAPGMWAPMPQPISPPTATVAVFKIVPRGRESMKSYLPDFLELLPEKGHDGRADERSKINSNGNQNRNQRLRENRTTDPSRDQGQVPGRVRYRRH